MSTRKEELLREFEGRGFVTYKNLYDRGYSLSTMRSLLEQGEAEKVSRGIYSFPDRPSIQWESLAYISLKHPKSVICLLSAARYYDMTTSNTPKIWMALPHGSRKPIDDNPAINVKFWRNPKLFEVGVETVEIGGVDVKITDPARTIVDLFRPYNKMIDERCNEALWYFIDNGGDMDLLHKYANEFGVSDVIENCVRMAICRAM